MRVIVHCTLILVPNALKRMHDFQPVLRIECCTSAQVFTIIEKYLKSSLSVACFRVFVESIKNIWKINKLIGILKNKLVNRDAKLYKTNFLHQWSDYILNMRFRLENHYKIA